MKVESKEIMKKVQEGGIKAKLIIEIVGKPKEYVEETIKKTLEKLKDEKKSNVLSEKTHETKEVQESVFSTFAEVELVTETFQRFLDICYEYAPSSIEILEPEKYPMKTKDMEGILNDLILRVHGVTGQLREALARIGILDSNFMNLMKRMVISLIEDSPKKISHIADKMGLPEDKTKMFLENFEKENVVKIEKDLCKLVKK